MTTTNSPTFTTDHYTYEGEQFWLFAHKGRGGTQTVHMSQATGQVSMASSFDGVDHCIVFYDAPGETPTGLINGQRMHPEHVASIGEGIQRAVSLAGKIVAQEAGLV